MQPSDIGKAINKLNKNKDDGEKCLNSNHLKYAPANINNYIAVLLQSMLIHGYTPVSLLKSCIVSIPKNITGNMQSSDNYRGISLCNAICKVIDLWMLDKCSHILRSSDLQFAFKAEHSTVLCTTVLKEILSHYNQNHSDVYVCMVDASKAFDLVNFGKLFSILLERKLPGSILRLLLFSYTNQHICAKWNNHTSNCFKIMNGVKQGSIISPILFTIYLDVLLERLKNNGVGCCIGDKFVGALAYADDLVLMSPSVRGLQQMLNVCEKYGVEYNVSFNRTKTECIKIGNNTERRNDTCIYMGGSVLTWKHKVKHLGSYIDCDLSDYTDINYKLGIFYSNVNKLLAHFQDLPSNIIDKLFQSFCTSFYGGQTWNLGCRHFDKISVAWQKAIRKVWKLPYQSHRSLLPFLCVSNMHIKTQLILRFIKFYLSMFVNDNTIVNYFAKRAVHLCCGTLNINIGYIRKLYNIDITQMSYAEAATYIKTKENQNRNYDRIRANILKEFCNIRDKESMECTFLTKDEVNELINNICLN